jgi:hypothetical protein
MGKFFTDIPHAIEISGLDPQEELDRVEAHLKTIPENSNCRAIYVEFRDGLLEILKNREQQ